MPYFLNTSNCDICYMGCTVEAGKVGYIEGTPLDARLVPASKPVEECEPQQSKPAKKRRRKQTRAQETALDSASVEPESAELPSSSEDVDASTLQCDSADSSAEEQQAIMQTDEVQLSQ